jgi:hypothetical protein
MCTVNLDASGKWSMNETGQDKADHSYWKGFNNRRAQALEFYSLPAQLAPLSLLERDLP